MPASTLSRAVRAEVEAWAEERATKRRRNEARKVARGRRAARLRPPADGRVWLDVETVALMLGCSPRWVRALAQEDRLSHVRRGARLWFVREHIEQVSAARAAARLAHRA